MPVRELPVSPNRFNVYQVKVRGKLDRGWVQNFQGITTDFDGETTTLNGIPADQSSIRGLLCYLWDFNVTVLSVILVSTETNQGLIHPGDD